MYGSVGARDGEAGSGVVEGHGVDAAACRSSSKGVQLRGQGNVASDMRGGGMSNYQVLDGLFGDMPFYNDVIVISWLSMSRYVMSCSWPL